MLGTRRQSLTPDELLATTDQPSHDLCPTAAAAVERLVYSPAEAAQALGCTRQTVHALINRGQLRRYKVGSSTKIPVADVLGLVGGRDA